MSHNSISLISEIVFGFELPCVGVDRPLKDDPDVSQSDLRSSEHECQIYDQP